MNNSQRVLARIIKEICSEKGIQYESFSFDWIFRLTKNGKTVHVFGYQFENNSATAQLICTDKSASSELLLSRGVPAVEHHFFMSPDDFQYIGVLGNWQRMLDLLKQHGRLVCKPNEGTGGKEVYQVSTPAELEMAATRIFAHYPSVAISPYYEIDREYRAILLNNEVKLVYSKSKPIIIGDGTSTVRQLILLQKQPLPDFEIANGWSEEFLQQIPFHGEKIAINWKHNLGQGASPDLVKDHDLLEKLRALALQAAQTVNVCFASVDIIQSGSRYLVLEINSGIMMENFAQANDRNYQLAKNIYRQAIEFLF